MFQELLQIIVFQIRIRKATTYTVVFAYMKTHIGLVCFIYNSFPDIFSIMRKHQIKISGVLSVIYLLKFLY